MSEFRVLVLNPNSNPAVTEGISAAVESDRVAGAFVIDCETLDAGPFGIESDDDIATVEPLILERLASVEDRYDAFVIACYSDPALGPCRERFKQPVAGIQESALRLSASSGRPFGALALGRQSIQRHMAYVRALGLQNGHVGERSLDITVDQAANDPATLSKIVERGRELVEQDGAETIILGCAGMAKHRRAAEDAIGVPVVDPAQAAIEMIRRLN